jgi:Fungal Rad9-like Rad53-binding/BRCA1 C Terminus (BRCT) domain
MTTTRSLHDTKSRGGRKRPLEETSQPHNTQRRRLSPRKRSPSKQSSATQPLRNSRASSATDTHSFSELASFNKGDTQPLLKTQNVLPINDIGRIDPIEDSYDDIIVTDPFSPPNHDHLNAFGLQRNVPITPGLSKRSFATNGSTSNGKSSVIKTPGSVIRGAFGFGDAMGAGGMSLTQAFMQSPNQLGQVAGSAHELRSDPVFERPSPNWVSIESPRDFVKRADAVAQKDDDVFRQPLIPASAAKRQHDTVVLSDETMPSPTQPHVHSVSAKKVKPRFFVEDSEELNGSEIAISPLVARNSSKPDQAESPEPKSTPPNGLAQFPKIPGTPAHSYLRNEVFVESTQDSDKVTDSQPVPQAEVPSSPPMTDGQSQAGSVGFMDRLHEVDPAAQAALQTSLPYPPGTSDMASSSNPGEKTLGPTEAMIQLEQIANAAPAETEDGFNGDPASAFLSNKEVENENSQFLRLAAIAAEPSQSLEETSQLDLLELDEDFEDALQPRTLPSSGSSPIDPKNRRNRPRFLQISPAKSQPTQERSQIHTGTSKQRSQSPSQKFHSDFDVIHSDPGMTALAMAQSHSKTGVSRPLKFLKDQEAKRNRRRQAMQKTEKVGGTIWDFDETQLASQPRELSDDDAPSTVIEAQDEAHEADDSEDALETVTDTSVLPIRFPNRVFAYCKNPYNACYPATFLHVNHQPDGKYGCRAVFDDGTVITVPPTQAEKWIFRLELHIGDIVKVEGRKSKLFVVVGFSKMLADEIAGQNIISVDIFGHQKVILEPKSRDSTSAKETTKAKPIVESITNIIIPPKEFDGFAPRIFLPPKDIPAGIDQTTATIPQTGISSTSRRSHIVSDHSNAPTPTLDTRNPDSALFSNMTFAVSIDDDEMKRKVMKLIQSNGGGILESGLEEVFDLSDSFLGEHSKSSNSFKSMLKGVECSSPLHLNSASRDIGFTAVIADSHSRKEKHMQALALGLPVLHHKWAEDCALSNTITSWMKYLLPAGQSSYLGGAVKSRVLEIYDPVSSGADLAAVLERRIMLLEHKKVVIVPGRGHTLSKRQRAFVFLMMAMGVSSLMQVSELDTAKKVLKEQGWDYIYQDQQEGSKLKRASFATSETNGNIITDEFVAQSLILGELMP